MGGIDTIANQQLPACAMRATECALRDLSATGKSSKLFRPTFVSRADKLVGDHDNVGSRSGTAGIQVRRHPDLAVIVGHIADLGDIQFTSPASQS